jgi:hypothetical protein
MPADNGLWLDGDEGLLPGAACRREENSERRGRAEATPAADGALRGREVEQIVQEVDARQKSICALSFANRAGSTSVGSGHVVAFGT